jgi:hypothetical protein
MGTAAFMWSPYLRIYGGGPAGRDLRDLKIINPFPVGMAAQSAKGALGEGLPENPESTGL